MSRFIRWIKHIFEHDWCDMPDYLRKIAGLPEGYYKFCKYCGKVEPQTHLLCAHCKKWYKAASNTVMLGGVYNQPPNDRNIILEDIQCTAFRVVCPDFDPIEEGDDPGLSTCKFYPSDRRVMARLISHRAKRCN